MSRTCLVVILACTLLPLGACGGGSSGGVTADLVPLPVLTAPACSAGDWTIQLGPVVASNTTVENQKHPQVVQLSSGGTVAVWASDDQDGSEYGVYARLFDAAGLPAGGEIEVNQEKVDQQWFPTVTALAGGAFVVAWTSGPFFWEGDPSPDGSGTRVSARIFNANGTPRTDEFGVNDTTQHDQRTATVITLSDGSFVCIYRSGREIATSPGAFGERGFVVFKRYDANGVQLVAETLVADYETLGGISLEAEPDFPHAAALEDGRFVVCWDMADLHRPNPTEIGPPYPTVTRARLYEASGTAVAGVIELSQHPSDRDTQERHPKAAVAPGGGFAIAWQSLRDGSTAVRVRHFDKNGKPRGDARAALTPVSADTIALGAHTIMSVPGFGFLICAYWRRPGGLVDLVAQMVDAADANFGAPFTHTFDGSFVFAERGVSGFLRGGDGATLLTVGDGATTADRDDVVLLVLGCP